METDKIIKVEPIYAGSRARQRCTFSNGAIWEYDIEDNQWIESSRTPEDLLRNFLANDNLVTLEMQAKRIADNPI